MKVITIALNTVPYAIPRKRACAFLARFSLERAVRTRERNTAERIPVLVEALAHRRSDAFAIVLELIERVLHGAVNALLELAEQARDLIQRPALLKLPLHSRTQIRQGRAHA